MRCWSSFNDATSSHRDVDGVGGCTAVQAAVQVPVWAHHFDFHIAQATEACSDAGDVVGDDAGVAHQHHVGCQALLVLLQEFVEVIRPHFLFALNDKLEVHRLVAGVDHGLQGLHMHEHLSLVVARTPRENRPFWVQLRLADHRLKSRRGPKVERVWRLHIVVAINQHGGQVGSTMRSPYTTG